MIRCLTTFTAIIALIAPNLASSQGIDGEYLCLTSSGQFDARLKFGADGVALLDFVTQEMVDNTPDLASQMGIPGEYQLRDDILILSFYDGFQQHSFEVEEFTMSSQSMGLSNCALQD